MADKKESAHGGAITLLSSRYVGSAEHVMTPPSQGDMAINEKEDVKAMLHDRSLMSIQASKTGRPHAQRPPEITVPKAWSFHHPRLDLKRPLSSSIKDHSLYASFLFAIVSSMTSLDSTLGALEIGILIGTTLYGISTVQVFLYTERNFKDPLWLRVMVS
jgi:hypothetical protein